MAEAREIPPRVTVGTSMNSAFIDGYWANIKGMTKTKWMAKAPAKRYENALDHMAAQAELAEKLAQQAQEKLGQ